MITRYSTVCTIEEVRDAFEPAIAEVRLSTGETFPIFDASVLIDAKLAHDQGGNVLPLLAESGQTRTVYLRGVRPIDVLAHAIPCFDCRCPMPREVASETNGGVEQFVCPNCSRRVYLGPARPFLELPPQARARIDADTDGVFALDHAKHHAVLMETFAAERSDAPPFHGLRAELEPFAESHALDALGLLPYQRRSLRQNLTLRLYGHLFNGRIAYKVI